MILKSLIFYSLSIITATFIFPILAAWILSFTNNYLENVLASENYEKSSNINARRSPFSSAITTSMFPPILHEFEKLENRSLTKINETEISAEHNKNYLSPYIMPPISINADDESDVGGVWSDEEDAYWAKN